MTVEVSVASAATRKVASVRGRVKRLWMRLQTSSTHLFIHYLPNMWH